MLELPGPLLRRLPGRILGRRLQDGLETFVCRLDEFSAETGLGGLFEAAKGSPCLDAAGRHWGYLTRIYGNGGRVFGARPLDDLAGFLEEARGHRGRLDDVAQSCPPRKGLAPGAGVALLERTGELPARATFGTVVWAEGSELVCLMDLSLVPGSASDRPAVLHAAPTVGLGRSWNADYRIQGLGGELGVAVRREGELAYCRLDLTPRYEELRLSVSWTEGLSRTWTERLMCGDQEASEYRLREALILALHRADLKHGRAGVTIAGRGGADSIAVDDSAGPLDRAIVDAVLARRNGESASMTVDVEVR